MRPGQDYFLQLNGFRGVAAMMVLLAHTSYGVSRYMVDHPGLQPVWEGMHAVGTYGVQLFFLISGFVIAMSVGRYSAKTFYWLRFARVYPLFFIATLGCFVLNQVLRIDADRSTGPWELFTDITGTSLLFHMPTIAPNAWTLIHEMWFYLLGFPLLKNIVCDRPDERINQWWTAAGIICMCVYLLLFPITGYFLIGNLFYVLYQRGIRTKVNGAIAVMAGIVTVGLAAMVNGAESQGELMSPWAIALFIMTLVTFWAIINETPTFSWLTRRPVQYIALISYSLYLMHPYPYFISKKVIFDHLNGSVPDLLFVALFFATMVLTGIAVAHVTWRLIERTFYDWVKPTTCDQKLSAKAESKLHFKTVM